MNVVGFKFTHDAAVAMIQDGRLAFSIELEKVGNRERRTKWHGLPLVDEVLEREGVDLSRADFVSVDGWKRDRMRYVKAAPYNEFEDGRLRFPRPLARESYEDWLSGKHRVHYASYTHTAGHLVGSYALSPFAKDKQDAILLTWDGGTSCQAYLCEASKHKLTRLGVLVPLCASVYGNMGLYFGPYKDEGVIKSPEVPVRKFGDVEWPGKLMSWLAHGESRSWFVDCCSATLYSLSPPPEAVSDDSEREHQFLRALRHSPYSDADVLASIHEFLTSTLIAGAKELCPAGLPCVLSGGAFLNIKWNSALRDCGHFSAVWAPPVVNDSGSAIGAAACEHLNITNRWAVEWDVYSGPKLADRSGPAGWQSYKCGADGLAALLVDEPVVVLQGRAEIGPRALGHRSILASPVSQQMKDRLNQAKKREPWRPVAPMCLESEAAKIFSPGTPDPYMLFEHTVRDEWKERIPAVVHLDGTARLQTVNASEPFLHGLLSEFHRLTGIPVLCNTSANLPGRGFFDSVPEACKWAEEVGIRYVYADGMLHFQ